jgi:hypothetical protein
MPAPVLWLMRLLQRWLGWDRVVLLVQRGGHVRTLNVPEDLPVSVRLNTGGSVAM